MRILQSDLRTGVNESCGNTVRDEEETSEKTPEELNQKLRLK